MAGKKEILEVVGEKTRFSSERQPEKNGRKEGVPNTATRVAKFLNAVMKGNDPISGESADFTVAELMDLQQIAKALNGDTTAWEKLNDRLEGKATQKTENLNLNIDGIESETLTPAQIEQIDSLLSGEGKQDNEGDAIPGKQKRQR